MPTAFAFNESRSSAQRDRVLREAQGYYAETFPRNSISNSSALATGVLYVTSIGLLGGDVVSNIGVQVATAGSTLTLFKMAILDKNGNRLAVSADQQSSGNVTVGPKSIAMLLQANGQPLTIPSDDLYYVAALSIGTTGPALTRSLAVQTDCRMFSTSFGNVGFVTGQSDIQSANTLVFTGATTMLQLWAGIA